MLDAGHSTALCALRPYLPGYARLGRVSAQGLDYIKSHYTKYEFKIPMRDGVRLFTSVYVPKDTSQRYPVMLSRTPYSVQPYGVDAFKPDLGPSPHFGNDGFIVVYQDVRGLLDVGG